MASFNTHLAVAGTVSLTAAGLCLQAGMVTQDEALLLLPLGIVAGMLPDVDSDHSMPARMVFGLLSFAMAAALVFSNYQQMNMLVLLLMAVAGGLFMRYFILQIFARITTHRGLFHSLPAALLSGLAVILLGHHVLHWTLAFSWLAAAFAGGGYLLHLLLDEFCSVDFLGGSFKQSFGSAMTVFSRSDWVSYLIMYVVVGLGVLMLPLPRLTWAGLL